MFDGDVLVYMVYNIETVIYNMEELLEDVIKEVYILERKVVKNY